MVKVNLELKLSKRRPPYDEFGFDASYMIRDIYGGQKAALETIDDVLKDEKRKKNSWKGYIAVITDESGTIIKTVTKDLCADGCLFNFLVIESHYQRFLL